MVGGGWCKQGTGLLVSFGRQVCEQTIAGVGWGGHGMGRLLGCGYTEDVLPLPGRAAGTGKDLLEEEPSNLEV